MGPYSHAEGNTTIANGTAAHAECHNSIAQGDFSHAGGIGTTANGRAQTVIGTYNRPDTSSLFIIGNGENGNLKNALIVDNDGRVKIQGNEAISDNKHLTTKQYVDTAIQNHTNQIINDFVTNKKIGTTKLVDLFYPIGSIYMSIDSISPANLFGGTWERIENRFLLAAGVDNLGYTAGSTGGAS